MNKIILGILVSLFCFASSAMSQKKAEYQLSTHILDVSLGQPAPNVVVALYKLDPVKNDFVVITSAVTDANGRVADLLPTDTNNTGTYKLRFETAPYFYKQQLNSIYPFIEVVFNIEGKGHYHIPITLSANGYSTYRGN